MKTSSEDGFRDARPVRAVPLSTPFRTEAISAKVRRNTIIRRRGWLIRRMLLVADILGLTGAFLVVELLFRGGGTLPGAAEVALFIASLPFWLFAAKLYGLYDNDEERTDHSTADEVINLFHLVSLGAWLLIVTTWTTGIVEPNFRKIVLFWILAIVLITGGRASARAFCRRQLIYQQNAVIIGGGTAAQQVARKLLRHPEYGINLVGFLHRVPTRLPADLAHLPIVGAPDEAPEVIQRFGLERVILAHPDEPADAQVSLVRSMRDYSVQVDVVPQLPEMISPGVAIHTVEGFPLLGLPVPGLSRSSLWTKRLFDITLALVGLLLTLPLFAVVSILIKLDSPGPVFFRQIRRCSGESTFRIFKFRTMDADAEERKTDVAHLNKHLEEGGDPRMFKIPEDPRITRIGRELRRYRVDELPQLLNVLKGQMSLVGPRPLILEEDVQVLDWARKRLDLKPGMTGLWQVLGSSMISFEEMIQLDYQYVTTWSLAGDLRLLFRTLPFAVRRGSGQVE